MMATVSLLSAFEGHPVFTQVAIISHRGSQFLKILGIVQLYLRQKNGYKNPKVAVYHY